MTSNVPSRSTSVTPRVFSPFGSLREELDRVFDGFGLSASNTSLWDTKNDAGVRIDCAENEKEIIVTAELPGVAEKDVEVTLQDNVLSIRGEKRSQRDEKKDRYQFAERTYGSFERLMSVPEGIDAAKVKAEFDKGILKVTLPKPAEALAKRKKIEIKSSAA